MPYRSSLVRFVLPAFLLLNATLNAQSVFDSLRLAQSAVVYFDFGRHDLNAGGLAEVEAFARLCEGLKPDLLVRITAHTDSVGSPGNNVALSERRARTVQQVLADRGLEAGRMELRYFGERKPEAANDSEEGRQRNRRATLEAYAIIPMAPYSGQVIDQKTGAGVPATVHISTSTRRDSVRTDTIGRYAVRLPRDSVVKIEAFAEGYFFNSVMQRIYGSPQMVRRMLEQPAVLALVPARTGETAAINNLFFVGNEAILLKSSEPELPKVLKFMQINPNIVVEIAGHINHPRWMREPIPDPTLSERRAKLVYNYLVKNGIPAERMTYKGYQNTEMLFPDTRDPNEMEQNRRVEIRVK